MTYKVSLAAISHVGLLKRVGLVCVVVFLVAVIVINTASFWSSTSHPIIGDQTSAGPTIGERFNWNTSLNGLTGYVLVNDYSEQLSQAIMNFYQLADIAAHWNMKIIEPFMKCGASGLHGIPQPNSKCYSFGDFYNVSDFHKKVDECLMVGGQNLVTDLREFLVEATD